MTRQALDLRANDDPQWMRFVQARQEATLFHHPTWSTLLAKSYGHAAWALVQTNGGGEIIAGIPVMEMRRPFGGRSFESLPYTDHCPPLATDSAALALFTESLVSQRELLGIRRIAIHAELAPVAGVQMATRAVQHLLPLQGSPQKIAEGFKNNTRWSIRKAEREGVEARVSQSAGDLDAFYRLHLETRRRLGVPVQPKRFMEAIWSEVILRDLGFVAFAYKDGQPIAAALYLAWNGNLIYKFSASDPRHWELKANNLVMWKAIEWACEHGYRQLDFGRTDMDNEGLRAYKRRWGAAEVPLVYSYLAQPAPGSGSRVPQRALARVIQSSPSIVCRAVGELLYGRIPASAA